MSTKSKSSTCDLSEENCESSGKRASWESRRQYLNEKYAQELDNAHSLSPEELRRLRRRISNRESARRLRKQRSEKLGVLQVQQGSLHDESLEINKQLHAHRELLQRLQAENAALRIRLGEAELLAPSVHLKPTGLANPRHASNTNTASENELKPSTASDGGDASNKRPSPPSDTPSSDDGQHRAKRPSLMSGCSRLAGDTDAVLPLSTSHTGQAPASHTGLALDASGSKAADVSRSIQETLAKAGFDLNMPGQKFVPRPGLEASNGLSSTVVAPVKVAVKTSSPHSITHVSLPVHQLHAGAQRAAAEKA